MGGMGAGYLLPLSNYQTLRYITSLDVHREQSSYLCLGAHNQIMNYTFQTSWLG